MAAAQLSESTNDGAHGPTAGLGWLVPWLIAAALVAPVLLVVFAAVRPSASVSVPPPPRVRPAPAVLPDKAAASAVARVFRRMKPFTVQPHMGASNGKEATCSIYSDGNLNSGARVTWAVTLCLVERIGGAS